MQILTHYHCSEAHYFGCNLSIVNISVHQKKSLQQVKKEKDMWIVVVKIMWHN